MKLLIISSAFPPSTMAGESDHAYYLAQNLAKGGCEVHVLCSQGVVSIGPGPLMIYPVMSGWSWANTTQIIRTIKQCQPEAILLFYSGGFLYQNHPMITFLPSIVKALFPHIRFITQFENHFPPSVSTYVLRVVRRLGRPWFDAFGTLLRRSDRIILLSHSQGQILTKHYPAFYKKSIVIPPPPLIPIVSDSKGNIRRLGREKLGLGRHEFVLVYFGLIYPGKGLEVLAEAFQIVSKHQPHLRLVIIGGVGSGEKGVSYYQSVKSRMVQLGISQKVIWTGGYESGSKNPSIYLHAADLCVLPMDRGIALNNSSLAATLAHGLPVVATRGENVEEPIRHEHNLFLCIPQDPQNLAKAISQVLGNLKIYMQLQTGANELAKEYFSWDVAVKQTMDTCFA